MRGSVVTIGYEGRTPDEIVDTLRAEGVAVVVDVRLNAISRRRGFSKQALAGRLGEDGIDYVHMPRLGNPRDNRTAFRAGEHHARNRYRAAIDDDAVDTLLAEIGTRRVALLCVERDASECHRSELVAVLRERVDLAVTHAP